MFLGEPAPSTGDLHFRLVGFPIRVHPFFWVATLLLGLGSGPVAPLSAVIWVVVVFVSILVHELGHAFCQRYYGGHPWITLHGLGGLASCSDCDDSPRSQVIIALAGPAAGFLFAAFAALMIRLTGHAVSWIWPWWVTFDDFELPWLNLFLLFLFHVNILWGLVNLLPVYPLDGGRVARELLSLRNARGGIILSLKISIGTAIAIAVFALTQKSTFTCVMFAILAYENYQALRAYEEPWR